MSFLLTNGLKMLSYRQYRCARRIESPMFARKSGPLVHGQNMFEWLRLIIFAGVYWLTARIGLSFVLQPEGVASIWPVSGLALATLLLVRDKDRYKYLVAILATNFLANFTGGNTALVSLGFALANIAEAALGWWTFYRIAGAPDGFSNIKEVWGLAAAALLANGLTALLGAAVPHFAFGAPYWSTWELWWIADGMGMMLIAPLLLSWATREMTIAPIANVPRLIEATAIILCALTAILIIFKILPTDITIINRPYSLFFLVIWMAIRFEAPGVSSLSLLIALPFLGNLLNPLGVYPWEEESRLLQLIQTQGYLIILNMIGLVVAASVSGIRKDEKLLQESERRYRELSIIDDLTQLYNSRYFYHQLRTEIDRVNRYGQPLTLLLLDLDNFKLFNDTYGHVEGDQVLFRLGQVVKRWLRQTDSAYRYGGEEFTILLPMTASEDGVVTAERIRTEFKKEIFTPASSKELHLTLSIGLAEYKTQEDMRAFVHRVDQLMYQGKKNGKDRVCSEAQPQDNTL
jgi:diguanylate cyclase (GGDEF)-like protein